MIDFLTLIDNCIKPVIFYNSKFTTSIRQETSVREQKILVSSANNVSSKTFDTLHRSFIYIKNNRGPKIDPEGLHR